MALIAHTVAVDLVVAHIVGAGLVAGGVVLAGYIVGIVAYVGMPRIVIVGLVVLVAVCTQLAVA